MSVKPKLILHVGSHKTGTTALQRTFGNSQKHLETHGVLYPWMAKNLNHHNLIRALTGDSKKGNNTTAEEMVADILKQAQGYDRVFLSSEKIYRMGLFPIDRHDGTNESMRRARIAFLTDLQKLLQGFDVTILLFLRRVDTFAESLYKEMTFRKELTGPILFDDFLHQYRMVFDYQTQIDDFRDFFDKVDVFSYDKLKGNEINAFVCDYLGVPEPKQIARPVYRRSATNIGTKFLQKTFETRLPSKQECTAMLDLFQTKQWMHEFGKGRCSLWPNADQLEQFIINTPGANIDGFFKPIVYDEMTYCSWSDEQQASANTMLEAWNSGSWIKRSLAKYRRRRGSAR